jgi:UDP-N-acetylglucosamine 2-epimerase (non-hydrolysing)
MSPKICFVLGTRPEIIKLYSSIVYCEQKDIEYFVIHTNQHYNSNMDKVFFEELRLALPKYNLGVGSGSHAAMTAKMLIGIEEALLKEKPTIVVVQGDTNSTLAGALVAAKLEIKVAHIEAGLRSYDRSMPEETNRIVVDHISDYLFPPTPKQAEILYSEGVEKGKVHLVGNTVVDAVLQCKNLVKSKPELFAQLEINQHFSEENTNFFLLTCHRPSNTEEPQNFEAILSGIQQLCFENNCKCIFPIHPRLQAKQELLKSFSEIITIEPVGFLQSIGLQLYSQMIFTDSGGIQEESCILQRKAVVLRTNTERPESVQVGGAILLEQITKDQIVSKFEELDTTQVNWSNPFGDGQSGQRIIESFLE